MAEHGSDGGRPLTTGWKLMIVLAFVIAIANSGIDALRRREETRFQNHEKRIDDLENRLRALQAATGKTSDKVE